MASSTQRVMSAISDIVKGTFTYVEEDVNGNKVTVNPHLDESMAHQMSGLQNAFWSVTFTPGMELELEKPCGTGSQGKDVVLYVDDLYFGKDKSTGKDIFKKTVRFGMKVSTSHVIKHVSISQLLRPVMIGHELADSAVRSEWACAENAFLRPDGNLKDVKEILETFKKGVKVKNVFLYHSKEGKEMKSRILPLFVVK